MEMMTVKAIKSISENKELQAITNKIRDKQNLIDSINAEINILKSDIAEAKTILDESISAKELTKAASDSERLSGILMLLENKLEPITDEIKALMDEKSKAIKAVLEPIKLEYRDRHAELFNEYIEKAKKLSEEEEEINLATNMIYQPALSEIGISKFAKCVHEAILALPYESQGKYKHKPFTRF